MIRKVGFAFLIFCFQYSLSWAQYEGANWVMIGAIFSNPLDTGINVLVKFKFTNSGLDLSTISNFNGNQGLNYKPITSSASNEKGSLQFIASEDSIANSSYKFIVSSNGGFSFYPLVDKSGIFIPLRGLGNNKFYFFKRKLTFNTAYGKLAYSLLDSTINQGQGGALFSEIKPPFIPASDSLFIIGVSGTMHKNGRDIWLLFLDVARNFYSVKINPCGDFGPLQKWPQPNYMKKRLKKKLYGFLDSYEIYPSTTMEFSPNGDHFAHVDDSTGDLFLYQFDNYSGQIQFKQRLDSNLNIPVSKYGANTGLRELCFSPNGRLVYLTGGGPTANFKNEITQYDLSQISKTPIQVPKVKSFKFNNKCSIYPALDGKLYLIYLYTKPGFQNFIGKINDPNLPYPQCNLDTNALATPANSYIFYGTTGSDVNEFRWPGWKGIRMNIANFTTTSPCLGKPISFIPEDTSFAQKITWDFGDGKRDTSYFPSHVYNDTGTYLVKMRLHLSCYTDSLTKVVKVGRQIKPNLGNDTSVFCYENVLLSVKPSFDHYIWNTSDTISSIKATAPGVYFVKTSNLCGFDSDSILIEWKTPLNPKLFTVSNLIVVNDSCVADSITFKSANYYSAYDVKRWYWSFGNGDTSNSPQKKYKYKLSGNYLISMKAFHLCYIDSSSRNLSIDPVPNISFGADTFLLCGEKYKLEPSKEIFRKYLWQDGSGLSSYLVEKGGNYKVTVFNACGNASDSINIGILKIISPNVITPNNDKKNDEFKLSNYLNGIGKLSIFNRWGELVHLDNSYNNNWSPESLIDGMYFYTLENSCEKLQGWLQILR